MCCAIGVMYLYMSENFPSEFRSIGVAIVSIFGRTGSILAPFVSNFLTSYNISP